MALYAKGASEEILFCKNRCINQMRLLKIFGVYSFLKYFFIKLANRDFWYIIFLYFQGRITSNITIEGKTNRR